MAKFRLTKEKIAEILEANEGKKLSTSYSSKNFREFRDYLITGGKIFAKISGSTSWSDSHFDNGDGEELGIEQVRALIKRRPKDFGIDLY